MIVVVLVICGGLELTSLQKKMLLGALSEGTRAAFFAAAAAAAKKGGIGLSNQEEVLQCRVYPRLAASAAGMPIRSETAMHHQRAMVSTTGSGRQEVDCGGGQGSDSELLQGSDIREDEQVARAVEDKDDRDSAQRKTCAGGSVDVTREEEEEERRRDGLLNDVVDQLEFEKKLKIRGACALVYMFRCRHACNYTYCSLCVKHQMPFIGVHRENVKTPSCACSAGSAFVVPFQCIDSPSLTSRSTMCITCTHPRVSEPNRGAEASGSHPPPARRQACNGGDHCRQPVSRVRAGHLDCGSR